MLPLLSDVNPSVERMQWSVAEYDLAATLESGQAFRWLPCSDGSWAGVLDGHWLRLYPVADGLAAERLGSRPSWDSVAEYLQIQMDYPAVLASFPQEPVMESAVAACRGLRLLRQPLWECLAGFLCSSNKQIIQIRAMIAALCRQFGDPVRVPNSLSVKQEVWSFPGPERIATATENELRACKLGYRAPYLREAARRVAEGELDLEGIRSLNLASARERLQTLPGVGPKVADCVLLFAYGFPRAFPIDVWVARALQELYFNPDKPPTLKTLTAFRDQHFGPNAGYAQQYLFHYRRVSYGK